MVGVQGAQTWCRGASWGAEGGLAEILLAQSAGGSGWDFRQGTGPWLGFSGNSWDTGEPVGVQRDQAMLWRVWLGGKWSG